MPRRQKKNRTARIIVLLTVGIAFFGIVYIGWLWLEAEEARRFRYRAFGIPIPAKYEVHGIDVSRYQQRISWESVKEMEVNDIRIRFAFIKATEGVNMTDPFFKRNWRKCREADIVRGAYHFFNPKKPGPQQARHFISKVDLKPGDLPPVLDIEVAQGVSPKILQRELAAWLIAVEAHYGVRPIIYTNISFYKRYLEGIFDDYPLWVAHYLQPAAPRIRRDWVFWQHSESGRVNGISSAVDFNVFAGDSLAFKTILIP